MELTRRLSPFCCLVIIALLVGSVVKTLEASPAALQAAQETDKLVYADFEAPKDKRPVSSRAGLVQLFGYQERPTMPSRALGLS